MNLIQIFMIIYMYELEKFLLTKIGELQEVSFQSDEANTDRPLKELIKKIIENEFYCIPDNSNIKNLVIENTEIDLLTIKDININRVLLPEEITYEIKEKIKNKKAIYTNPDICLELSINNQFFMYLLN